MIAREVTKTALFKRKVPKAVSKTVMKFPNIGKEIESFVRQNHVGQMHGGAQVCSLLVEIQNRGRK